MLTIFCYYTEKRMPFEFSIGNSQLLNRLFWKWLHVMVSTIQTHCKLHTPTPPPPKKIKKKKKKKKKRLSLILKSHIFLMIINNCNIRNQYYIKSGFNSNVYSEIYFITNLGQCDNIWDNMSFNWDNYI